MAAAAPPYEILALPMGEHRCRALRAALDARRWRPKYRDGVAKDLCYSDTIFQGPILDAAKRLLPQEMFELTTIQANRYDPVWWTRSEIRQETGNYKDSRKDKTPHYTEFPYFSSFCGEWAKSSERRAKARQTCSSTF